MTERPKRLGEMLGGLLVAVVGCGLGYIAVMCPYWLLQPETFWQRFWMVILGFPAYAVGIPLALVTGFFGGLVVLDKDWRSAFDDKPEQGDPPI